MAHDRVDCTTTVTSARSMLTTSADWVAESIYYDGSSQPVKVDMALMQGLDYFAMKTQCTRSRVSVAIASGDTEVDVTAAPGGKFFLPGCLYNARIGWDYVAPVSFDEIRRLHDDSAETNQPDKIAWEYLPSAATIYPTADAAYTLYVAYWEPLNTDDWMSMGAGSSNSADVIINIPDRWLRRAVMTLCRAILDFPNPDARYTTRLWQEGEAFIRDVKGLTGQKTTSFLKDPNAFMA